MRLAFVCFKLNLPSTWTTHDLASIAESLGHEALILELPNGRATPSSLRAAIVDADPDALLAVNLTRRNLGGAVPRSLPMAAFMMDGCDDIDTRAFADAFNDTRLDIMTGYVDSLPASGYDPARLHPLTVPIDPLKFFDRHRFSTTPPPDTYFFAGSRGYDPADHAKSRRQWYETKRISLPGVLSVIDKLKAEQSGSPVPLHHWTVEEILLSDPSILSLSKTMPRVEWEMFMRVHFHFPIYEAIFRQAAVRSLMASGKKVTVCGGGWDANPEFSSIARPPIPHGRELADAYASHSRSLHMSSLFDTSHHRMSEILLSGGTLLTMGRSDPIERRWTVREAESFISDQRSALAPLFNCDLFHR